MYSFDWSYFWGESGLMLLAGFVVTLKLAAWSAVFALSVGLIVALVRWQKWRLVEPACWFYVEFIRNTPVVVQILFWYFSASVILPAWAFGQLRAFGFEFGSVVLALAIYHGAFIAEIVRAGLASVSQGQQDAYRSLGLSSWQGMRLVVLPQAIRVALPPLVNELVALIKNTSFGIAIGVAELTYAAKHIETYAFRGVEALMLATLLYLTICLAISGLATLLNHRLDRHLKA